MTDAGGRQEDVGVAIYTRLGVHRWTTSPATLCFDATPGSPWLLVPPPVRSVFDSLVRAGIPLADSVFGPPMLGVKCGCNDAFIVTLDARSDRRECDHGIAAVRAVSARDTRATPHHGCVEQSLLRPVVRGETLSRWVRRDDADESPPPRRVPMAHRQRGTRPAEWIIWTHEDSGDARGKPLAVLPPHAASWLGRWRHQLAARSDTRGQNPWWALFRTESASSMQPRVVWPDLGRAPRATLIPVGDPTVALNSCYIARARDLVDALALTALMNSAIAAAWLNILAEPARGGYRRYMGWTVGLLPLPQPWERTRSVMAPLAATALAGAPPTEARLTETVAAAYGLDLDALQPLLSWSGA
jgi:hypothetical protein